MNFGRNPIIFACLLLCLFALPFVARAAEEEKKPDITAGKAESVGPTYVQIAPFVVPVIGSDGPEEMVSLMITLEVGSQEKADFVRQRLPKLNDAYMQTLYGALDRGTIKRNGLINVTLLKDKLVKATSNVLGQGYADDVLVQALAERKLKPQ